MSPFTAVSGNPSSKPRTMPSLRPSGKPSAHSSKVPSEVPSGTILLAPTAAPSEVPSFTSSLVLTSAEPSFYPSGRLTRVSFRADNRLLLPVRYLAKRRQTVLPQFQALGRLVILDKYLARLLHPAPVRL
ncbi:MAG: hypothetical protein ACREOZ_04700 [Gloeomargaritales cyanobacterium]